MSTTATIPASSVAHWRSLSGRPAREIVCPTCDVSWYQETDDCCWICGAKGASVLELIRSELSSR